MELDPKSLRAALAEIPTSTWSLPSTYTDTGVHHGYRRVVLVSAGQMQKHADVFKFVWDALTPVWDAGLSWLDPGGFIVPHRDAGPWRERWQVPIQVSGHGPTAVAHRCGKAFRVEHWKRHAVINCGVVPRIHLVVDRDVQIGRDPLPFEVFPASDDMADLIERSRQ